MKVRHVVALLGLSLFLMPATEAEVLAAGDCGEPVPAPKYQIGDTWVSRSEKGAEAVEEVIGFEGEYARVKWLVPWRTPDKEGVSLVDADGIIRKVIKPNGKVVTSQGVGTPYDLIGQKHLDFPLQVGKKWAFTYRSASGATGWRIYRVLACEEVSTPAGKFSALKIEIELRFPHWNGTYHLWYAPAAKASVRWKIPGGFTPRAQDIELIKYRLK